MNPSEQPTGFLAAPTGGTGPAVLVLHAWWGLNDTIKGFCTRLAQEGFVAFAPDLYHGKVATNVADAESLGKALDARHVNAKAEIAQAAAFLMQRASRMERGLAVIGFSLGAYYALALSATDPELVRAVVLFYGTGDDDFTHAKAAYLGHFAERDRFEPPGNVNALEAALERSGREVTFHRYAGAGHWFFEPDRTDAYDPAAARLAWERTVTFLRGWAAGEPPESAASD
ncbi:MAG TPA: dienelactone hydrolase family protein [Casimicrobiaceae bacterium]|nr:dienelactone hydrolase family protein [Casimicrobiaceae bacterium]